jgi:hypothetical protein
MTAHPEDRAHKSEGRVAPHNEDRGSKKRKHWDAEQPDLQNKAYTSGVRDTPYAFKRVKIPSTVDERRVTVGDGDEGAEERIPVSGNAKRRSSSPPQQILNNPAFLQEVWAIHCSRRAKALQELQARYAPAAPTSNIVAPRAPQSDKYDNLSYNHVQQSKMPSPTYNEENTADPPHYPGKLSTPSDSQESFYSGWLDDIDHVLGPDGKLTVHDPGSGSS